MAGGKIEDDDGKDVAPKEPPVRRGSRASLKSLTISWPWKKESDTSASFLRAARAGNLEKVLEFLKTNTDINTCNPNGLNALHLASKEGHVHVVRELLNGGANVDAATKKGNTALHIASLAGQEEIVRILVEHNAGVNLQSQNGFTPLYMAAQENHDSVVRYLLSHQANQSLATEDGFTPLAVALQQGHDKVVAVLLENDTRGKVRLPALHIAAKKDDTKAAALLLHTDHNPDVTSKSGFTPLHIAAHYGNESIAALLIQRGADVNFVAKHQITPLHVASKWGKGNMVSLLLEKNATIDAKTRDGLSPLHCAARSGHETVVDMLLEKGAPITGKTKNGLAPLHMASQGDHVDAARILLYHKAPVDDVTVDFLTSLHVAAHCGHVRVAKLLLDRKADPNSRALNGFTPLHIACKKNRIKVVELLLKHGASIEATTESGLTPLHVASFMGCMNIVIYLLQHGAAADVPTVRGETPLHLAARANQTDIIRILLRNGAQVDARAREQQTALHIASRLGNSDIVVLLLQHGAAVDATTKDHYTALHIASKEGQEEVAGVLLDQGASLTAATKKGFTPLHLAAKYGNPSMARLLLQRDAPVDAQGKNGVTPLHVAAHYDHQNVALLLLDHGASPHATAKNGYTPLHIATRKNQLDIAGTLLQYGAKPNAESKAGFTPLHLTAQEGHTDMTTLLVEHGAEAGQPARNGLTPLHLCAQEDRVGVAAVLVKSGATIDSTTKAGYTPLHVASHFGQVNMVRFLLQHQAKVHTPTQLGYTPLHQAAQQGHTQIVNLLIENKAEPNAETKDGKTALSIAQRLGYISVVETLKIVTETTITTSTTTTTEEKYKVVVPETMHETFMSESEDEGGDDTMLGDQSYRYLTSDEMKSLGDDSLPIDVTRDEKMDMSFQSSGMGAIPPGPGDHISPQHLKEQLLQQQQHYLGLSAGPTDNVDVSRHPALAGSPSMGSLNASSLYSFLSHEDDSRGPNRSFITEMKRFLVSFMVDARGGAMRGCRHSGVRVIIPPRKASMPMRVTCRYLKKDKLVHAPPLMEGEALASRILEMGPAGAKFLGPVILEVPHFASLRGKEREIVILRSDNGETWREHTLEATEDAVQEVLNESFDGDELKQLEELNTSRITRILTTDFPQYFAIVTRIRQEVHAIGPDGGMVSSTVVPQVQAVFPQGALTKKIKVGLQAQPISPDLAAKLLGNRVAVSPIVTVEPRRRKFHKPITLTLPVPQAASKGMINQYSGDAPTLRLLCSITGGTTRAQWEDVTGSTPLTFVNDCVSFTTTVSARFWLMDCTNIPEATKMATELYREAIHVPFMSKFVVFAKRHQLEEARMRVFCMTDDREDKTLESQEQFIEVAKSRDVEVLEGKTQYLEFAGNLVPITKSGDQLAFNFYAFRENRLPFTVRVKDQHTESVGRVAFMRQPKVGRGDAPQNPICNLNIELPETIQPEPAPSEPDLLSLEKKYTFLSISKADTIHKADLRLSDISNMLDHDWVSLARELDISDSDINIIKSQYPDNSPQQALVMLRLWMQTAGNKATGNALEKGLRKINRVDIVNQCIFNVEPVTDDKERAVAKAQIDTAATTTTSTAGNLNVTDSSAVARKERDLNRDASMDVSYDEHDLMKEAESAEEDEDNQKSYQGKEALTQVASDLSPTYETEEKKYAAEEKIVKEETKALKTQITQEDVDEFLKDTELPFEKKLKEMSINNEIFEKAPAEYAGKSEIVEEDFVKTVADRSKEEPVLQTATTISLHKDRETDSELLEKQSKQEPFAESSSDKKDYIPEKFVETCVTKHVFDDGSQSIITTKTTERKSFIIDDGSGVEEKIVLEKRTDSEDLEQKFRNLSPSESSAAKSEILQKLGEELGKLDDRLEEKFKEKRRAGQPDEADNQAALEAEVTILPRTKTVVATHFQVVDEPDMVKTQLTSSVDAESTITAVADEFKTDTPVSAPHGNDDAKMALDDIDPYAASAAVKNVNATSAVRDATDVTKEFIIVDVGSEEQLSPKAVTERFSSSSEEPASLGSSAAIDCSEPVSSEEVALLDNDAPVTGTPTTSEGNNTVKIAERTPTTPTTSIPENEDDTKSGQILSDELTQTSVDKMASQEASEVACAEAPFSSIPSLQSAEEALVKQTQVHNQLDQPLYHQEEKRTMDDDDDDRLLVALGRRVIAYAGEGKQDVTTCPPEGWNYFGPSKTRSKTRSQQENEKCNYDSEQFTSNGINTEKLLEVYLHKKMVVQHDKHDIAANSDTMADQACAHRPTTLMITTNSNESGDEVYVTSNELCHTEDKVNDAVANGNKLLSTVRIVTVGGNKQDGGPGGALEGAVANSHSHAGLDSHPTFVVRPPRVAPRTATLVKVKVEKRAVCSHARSERSQNHGDQGREQSHVHVTVENKAASVEEELAGLMAEVKAATSQIKQEVKQIRQSDTPTPDTPTPLREFRDFLNKEDEQDLERLPTIAELQRENEDDSSNVPSGEIISFRPVGSPFQFDEIVSVLSSNNKVAVPVKSISSINICSSSSNSSNDIVFKTTSLTTHSSNKDTDKQSDYIDTDSMNKCTSNLSIKHKWKDAFKLHNTTPKFTGKPFTNDDVKWLSKPSTQQCEQVMRPMSYAASTQTIESQILLDEYEQHIDTVNKNLLLETVINGIDSMIAFLECNVCARHDISSFVYPILHRIEMYENQIKHLSFVT